MNALVFLNDGQPVTTSIALAEGAELEHRAVMQLIRNYLSDFEDFGRVAFEMRPFETAGGTQSREVVILNEPQTTFLFTLMRNSPVVLQFKKRLVKAFYELAQQAANPFLTMDRAGLLRVALESEEKVVALTAKVQADAPKVSAFERLCGAQGSLCLRDSAKALQVQPHRFNAWLQANGWIYRRPGNGPLLGYQDKVQRGFLTHKVNTYHDQVTGDDRIAEQVRITAKGLTRLADLLNPGRAAA